jgi:hypothetical protein
MVPTFVCGYRVACREVCTLSPDLCRTCRVLVVEIGRGA